MYAVRWSIGKSGVRRSVTLTGPLVESTISGGFAVHIKKLLFSVSGVRAASVVAALTSVVIPERARRVTLGSPQLTRYANPHGYSNSPVRAFPSSTSSRFRSPSLSSAGDLPNDGPVAMSVFDWNPASNSVGVSTRGHGFYLGASPVGHGDACTPDANGSLISA